MSGPIILGLVVMALVLFLINTYNGLVKLRQRVRNAWAQVEVQLRRRYDLIPNLVNAVKGYAAHEKSTFQSVTEARTRAMSAGNVTDQMQAENMLTTALRSLFAVAEAYPELKTNTNFLQLQSELSDTEGKIAFARQFFNDTVQKFNTAIQVFPNNLVAGMLGFSAKDYFTLDDEAEARQPVKVQF